MTAEQGSPTTRRTVLADPPRELESLEFMVDRWKGSLRPPIRSECVCGGLDIVAASGSPEDVLAAVQRHQIEPTHLAWDQAHGVPLSAWQRASLVGR